MVRSAVETALAPVKAELAELKELISTFVAYEVETDAEEAQAMGVVTDKVTQALTEAQEQSTVIDGLVVWAQAQKDVLEQVRADLATAIANGATEADLAALDEAIASFDSNTARVTQVVTEGTAAEGESPSNPVPSDPTEGGTVDPTTGQPVEPGTGV